MSNYLFGLCNPKRNITAFTNPPARVELQNNPYSIEIPDPLNRTQTRLITQYDLNMRRKVEILKYNSTKVSTQTNSLTKSQKWSNVVSNKSSYVVGSSSSKLIHKSTIDCPGKPTPSNHSDIPGDVIMLYQNDDVPLYNYNVDMFSHSVLPPSTLKDWLNDFGTNVYIYDSAFLMKSKYLIYSTVSNIFIQNVDTTYYSYSLTTPVAFTFSGSYTPPEEATITLHIEELYLTIYYNGSIVGNKIYPNKQQFQNTNYIFKISQTSTNTNKIGFKATVFLTNLRWDCIKLINKSNFTYSLNLNVSYTLTSSTNVVLDPANNINYNGNFMQSSSHYFIANFITTENLMDITNDLNIDVISDEVIPEYSIYSLIENNICAKYPVLISYISDLNDNSNVFFTISYSLDINANKYNALIQPLPLENSLVIVVDNNHNFIVKSSSSSVPAFLYNTIYTININAVYDNFITDYSNPIRCIYLTPPILLNKQVSFLYNNVNFIFVNTTIYDPKVSFFANITDVFDNNTVITSPTILSSFMFRSENNIKVTQQDTTPDATTVFFKNKLYNVKIRAGYNNKYSDYSLVQSCIYLSTPFLLEPTVNGNESFIIPFKVDSSFPYPAETTYTATVTQLNGDPLPLPFVESSIIVVNKNHNFIVDLSYSVEPAFVYNIPYNQPYYVEINAIYDDFITAYSRPVICIYLTPPILQKKNVIFISNNIMFIFFNTTIYDENVTFFANITDVFDNNTVITSPINVLSQSVRNGNILNVTPTTGFSKNNLYNVKIRAEYNSIYSDYSLVESCIYLPTPVLLEPTVNGNQSFIIPFTIDSSFPYPDETTYTATVTQLNGDPLPLPFVESSIIVVNNNNNFIVDFSYSVDPLFLYNIPYNVAINAIYDDFITDYSNPVICIYLTPPILSKKNVIFISNNIMFTFFNTTTYDENVTFFANITDVFDNNTVITSPINVSSNENIINVTPRTVFFKNKLYNVKIRAEYNSIYSDYSLVQSCIYLPTPVLLEPTVNGNQSFIIPFTIDSSFPYPGGTVYTATVTQLNGDYLSFSFVELIVVNNNFIVDFSYSDDPALLSNRQYNVAINAAYNDFITDYSNSIICIYLIPPSLTQCFPKMDANNQLQLSITQTITYHDNIEFSQTIFNTSTNSFIPTEEYDALYEPVISNQLILSSIYPHSTQLFTYFILYKITMIAFYNRIVAVSNEISYVFVAPPTNLQYNRFGKYFTFNLPILDPLYPLSSPAYNTYINEGLNSSFDFDSITNYIPLLTDNITTNFNDGLKTGTYIVTSCDGSENAYNAFTSDGFSIENLTSYTTTVDLSNIDGAWTQIKLPIPIQMTSFTVDFLDRPAPVQIKIVASNDGSIWTNYATSNNDDIITVNTIGSPTVYTLGSIIFYKFTTGGKITLSDTLSGKILIVGGGGGGGTTYVPSIEGQGGGGAGQMVFGNINLIGSSEYTVTIGEGAPSNNMGSDSSVTGTGLNNYIAIGGGKGGSSGNSLKYGGIGGSGGGSSGYFGDARGGAYRSRTNTADLTYYGNNGGDGILYTGGGGGGGAKESGSTSNNNKGGAGGNGKLWIDGNTYAGGGGGGGSKYQDIYNISDAGGAGGAGGGGGGGGGDYDYVALNHAAVDGTENTGGGGGGGEPFTPGNRVRPGASGGSGVVIFAFDKNSITTIFTNTTQYQYYRFIYTTPATGTVLFKSINFTGRPTSPAFAISSTPNINDKINMNAYYGTTYKNSIVSNTVSF